MKITNGWYEFLPNEYCPIHWLDAHQIVQVIEGKVWVTFVADEVTVTDAENCGEFLKRITLTK